mmetsp:Transcript_25583/g.73614  ORF Transcript_25583/g.73614 Transcript_25583/m.73614 type:complete len:311 (+) Transcript_25583:677-1609(+)
MKRSVIIHQKNITRFHRKCSDVLLACALDLLAILQTQRLHRISVEDFSHTNLRNSAGSSVSELSGVVVSIVEPHRKSSHGVSVDWRLGNLNGLQTTGLSIHFVHHFQVHVELGGNSSIDQSLHSFLNKSWKTWGKIKIADRNSHLSIIQLLKDLSVHFSKNGGTVSNQEPATTLGRLLEAHESSVGSSSLCGRLSVKSDVVSSKRRLVDLFVQGITLGGKLSKSRGVKRVQAGFQFQSFIHFTVSRNSLHQIETSEPNGSMLQKIGTNLVLVLLEIVRPHSVVSIRSSNFQRTMGSFRGFILCFHNIDAF